MSVNIKLKHSAVNGKAPLPTDLTDGELALNVNAASPAAYIKDSAGNIVKLAGAGSASTPDASETVKGVAEIATKAEVTAGTDDVRIVSPLKLKQALDALPPGTTVAAAAPATPEGGQAFFDTTTNTLKIWDGTAWKTSQPGTTVAAVAPAAPENGQDWFDSKNNVLKVWDGAAWQTATPTTYTYPGGVEQTVQQRLEQYVSVKDFGAVGDGVANENQAISDAFDAAVAAGGGTVYFPAGTYVVTTKFEYSGVNIAIRGESRSNTIIKYGSPTNAKIFKINNGDNCTVSDLTFDLNGCTKEFADSISVNNCKNVEIRNCQFLDLNPQKTGNITIGTGDGNTTEFFLVYTTTKDYQLMPGTVVVTAGTVQLSDEELADGHLFLKDPILDGSGRVELNQTTQGQILYGSNNGEFTVRVKFQTAPASGVPVTLNAGYSDQRQPILVLNCVDVLVDNNILKCLGRIKVGRPSNRVIVSNNIINGCNDNGITLVNIAPGNADPNNPGSLSPQARLINRDLLIQNNIISHTATTGIFFGGDGGVEAVYPLEFHNIQITNNNITTSGGSGIKFTPALNSGSQGLSGRIIIANNNIDMQYITKDDGTRLKVVGNFTTALNLASGSNELIVSGNNIDATGSSLGCVSYEKLHNCVFSGNRFKNIGSRVFRGNASALIENCVFSDNSFTCSAVFSPQKDDTSLIRDTTFVGNVMVSDNATRSVGSFINGGALEDVIISNNIFRFADGLTVNSTPLSAVSLTNPIESSFQITNNRFVGDSWWNPDIIRVSTGVTFAPGSIKFPNSGPIQKTFQTGRGTPEGAVFAARGSIFIDEDTGKTYAKTSGGVTSNTGWTTP